MGILGVHPMWMGGGGVSISNYSTNSVAGINIGSAFGNFLMLDYYNNVFVTAKSGGPTSVTGAQLGYVSDSTSPTYSNALNIPVYSDPYFVSDSNYLYVLGDFGCKYTYDGKSWSNYTSVNLNSRGGCISYGTSFIRNNLLESSGANTFVSSTNFSTWTGVLSINSEWGAGFLYSLTQIGEYFYVVRYANSAVEGIYRRKMSDASWSLTSIETTDLNIVNFTFGSSTYIITGDKLYASDLSGEVWTLVKAGLDRPNLNANVTQNSRCRKTPDGSLVAYPTLSGFNLIDKDLNVYKRTAPDGARGPVIISPNTNILMAPHGTRRILTSPR